MTEAATTPASAFQVTVQPSGRAFTVEAGEAILAAAIRQGIGLPYGCKDGACGSCKSRKLEGTVVHGAHQTKAPRSASRRRCPSIRWRTAGRAKKPPRCRRCSRRWVRPDSPSG